MEKMLILAGVFFVVSTIFSMLGMGGGILYVPILLIAGYTMDTAPGISLILILGTSLAALFNFSKKNMVDKSKLKRIFGVAVLLIASRIIYKLVT